jgi:tripartite-type tricarboxylate transporter receptor subunit TctC
MTVSKTWSFLAVAALLSAPALTSHPAMAQADYPNKEIHVVNGFPPGSGADVLVRYFTEKLPAIVGKPFIVDYKVGANGNIALEHTARSKPDGYTLLMNSGSSLAASMHLYKKPAADVTKDFQIAAVINKQTFLVAVDAKSPYQTLAQLTAAMKAKGDKASYATTSPSAVILGSLYKSCGQLQAVDVPYRTAQQALADMLGGSLDYSLSDPVFALSQQSAGTLRLLAAGSESRIKALGDVPTLVELGCPNVDVTSWWSAIVPKGTPRPIIDKINAWYNQILRMPETEKFLNGFGGDVWIGTPEEGQARLERDTKTWGDMIRFAKIEPL